MFAVAATVGSSGVGVAKGAILRDSPLRTRVGPAAARRIRFIE